MIPRFKPYLNHKEFKRIFSFKKNAIENFEKDFSRVFNTVDTVTFPYGRSAEWAFFKALDIRNTEVIIPAYTCSVVAYAVSLSQNIPRFIDINLNDYKLLPAMQPDYCIKSKNQEAMEKLRERIKYLEDTHGNKLLIERNKPVGLEVNFSMQNPTSLSISKSCYFKKKSYKLNELGLELITRDIGTG